MVKFMYSKKLATVVIACILLVPQLVSAQPTSVLQKESLSSIIEIKDYVKTHQDTNILLYDESGNILNEFHSDGNIIDYHYNSNGVMTESTDSYMGKQVYEKDVNSGKVHVKTYKNNVMLENKDLVSINDIRDVSSDLNITKSLDITPQSTTVYENTNINGVNMNTLISDANFIKSSTMTSASIQSFLESKNSILKNTVLIYYLDTSGNPYFKGDTINAASAISSAATANGINPKVILATLQKESTLVSATPGSVDYSSRRFYYAMGYGATDSGDDKTKAGFNLQISGGAQTLKNRYTQSPSSGYPIKLPDGVVTSINGGLTKTSGGVTYKNYVWVNNRASYSLYRYTPHTIDVSLLPTLGGGNYLFVKIASGWWGTNLWN
jgi:YD repeat-containing protein